MQHCDYFDYWGSGTEVTVSSETTTSPSLFPLVQCNPGSTDTVTVGCLAYDFFPKSVTFQWTDGRGNTLTSKQYPPVEKNNKYTGVSSVQVPKSDWDSKGPFNCSVTHSGGPKSVTFEKDTSFPPTVTLLAVPAGDTQALVCTIEGFLSQELSVKWKKNGNDITGSTDWAPQKTGNVFSAVSVLKVKNTDWDSKAVYTCEVTHQQTKYTKTASKAHIEMTLKQPSPKEIFINNQAKLECVVTGQDQNTVNGIQISWEINGLVTKNSIETRMSGSSKISTMTCNRTEWNSVNTVRCSAIKVGMTPVIQDLNVKKGDGSEPKVTVHILPEEDISRGDSAEVTLVCLVSSSAQQDYYIAWLEQTGQNPDVYIDGINFPPQKTQQGHSVTSIYHTTKDKWNKNSIFSCNVWPAGSERPVKSRDVSKALSNSTEYCIQESNISFALSCTDGAIVEDEYSSLWSTTSSFIFLFITSLLYSMIFSLVKMKSP